VDTGAKKLAGSPEEKITEGLDGLRERLEEYYKLGARFTKWRAVYNISENFPSELAVKSNAHALARYASLVQESKMVPIIEPEVLMDGEHSIKKCYEVTARVLKECYKELTLHKVNLRATILKPNMILPGNKSKIKSNSEEIAKMTIQCLGDNVPTEVPGIFFLSGGQTEIEATRNLNEINKSNFTSFVMSFSYGRALQQGALKKWGANIKDINETQKIFNHRAKMNGLATSAEWTKDLEN
jgi:fructose-bisphosphate aldolase class I